MNKLRHKSYLFAFALFFVTANASAFSVAEIAFNKLKSNITRLLKEHNLEQGLAFMPPPPTGTISVRVNSSSDDAEQNLSLGTVSTNSNDLELVQDGTANQQTGMRFNGIAIPKGAIITSAYVEFIAKAANSGTVALTLSGQASDNATTFTTGSNNISSRTKTSATVAWSPANWTTIGAAYQTTDISNIVQEIVNRSGWASGNSMVIMATGPTTATRTAQSYDGVAVSAPLLVVNYTLVEICGNGLDDDSDGLIDGADLDCGTFCPTGSLSLERWLNIGSGSAVSDLTGNANYPNSPSETASLSNFDGPDNYGDNYGTRVRGYITPSLTGVYSFNLTSDDASEYYLSTDANPANKVLIASVSGYTGTAEYTKYTSQTSANLTLVAGQSYYVELLQKESGGSDHFQVYWKTPASSTWTIVPGANLRPFGCVEICSNGIDDDGDGLVDAADADCGTFCNTGKLNLERWLSISGTAVSDLTSNANYPNSPSETTTLTSFDGPDNYADNFGQRVRGFLSPTQTGIYTFNLTSDDAGELYLSTDANSSNKKLIASVSGWTNTTEYTKYTSQTSYSILLNAGRNYYVEVLNKEGTGNDHFQVYWKTPSNTNWTIIPGTNLRPYACSEICGNNIDDDGDGFTDCNCDLMINGEFDNGFTGWGMTVQPGNSATGALDNTSQLSGVMSGAVTITTASGTDWHIQAYQTGLSIKSGKTYTIGFQSKSTGSRTMGVALQQSVSPYTVYWSQTVTLSATASTFSFDFPSTITNNGQVSIVFNMGQSNKKIWIDKISVIPKCAVEICGNGIDDDTNGLIDCADNACPVPTTAITGTNTICNGGSTTLTSTGGGTYAWSNGASSAAITVSPSISTTYIVTVTNSSACTVTASQLVTVNALPAASISGTNSICAGASTTLTASGGGTYSWSTGATTAAITVTPATTTTYVATVTNAAGCTATASRTVTVNSNPTASISGTSTICAGASTTLTAAGGGTYVWSNGATTAAITVTPAATTTYTATVTNASGCTATASSTVTVNSVPTVSISGTNSICAGANTTLTATGGGTYVWSNGATTSAITVTPAATTTYIATVTNASGCTATASNTVTVNALPTAIISGTNTICSGASTTLTATGGGTYVWSNGATTSAITVTPATTTTYTATVTNASGCTSTASSTVTVNTLPTASISGTNTICAGTSTTLTASGGGTYTWSNGATTAAITVTPATTTIYTATVTNASGCTATASRTVTVNSLPSASVTGTNTICSGVSTTLTASGGTSYVWSNGATTAVITVTPISTTTYTATVTNASGCTATASRIVTVNASPTALISGTTSICVGNSTTLTASGGSSYVWSNGATTAAITMTPASTMTYTVIATNASGCTASTSSTVTVNTCTEICNNSIDDDGDGLVDCSDTDCKRITLATPVVSECINQPLQDVATVSVQVSWINAPANDQIEVSIYGQTERINTGSGITSPQTVTFTVPANGATNKTITAAWRNNTSLCSSTATYNAPVSCSSDQVSCNILYLCGLNKPSDGDPWDRGFLAYLDEVNGSNTVYQVLTKADASGMGTYNINSPSTPITVNLNSYSLVVISATTETSIAPALVTALKNYTGAVMNSNYDIIDDLGMSATSGSYQTQSNLYIDNSISKEIYNFNNDINPTNAKIFTRATYTSAADAYLWTNAGGQTSATNGVYFVYSTADAMPGVATGHGRRVYLGYHSNGVYANTQNGGALPAPVSNYFVPATHLTLEGKYYFDLAILEATKACNVETCNNGIDDNDNGLVDCQETVCGLPVISNAAKTNATNCPGQNNGQITVTASGSNLEYSVNNGAAYQASNIFTGLAVGTYNVRVRNSLTGCYVSYASNPIQITGITCIENCTNGIDDDGDGLVDCVDSDCKPSANAGTDANICLGLSHTLSASALGGTAPYSYTWSNGLGSGQSKSVTPLITTTYTVTISSAGGCTSTDAVIVTVTPCSEICADGIDNDADGLVDCADPDCIATATPHLTGDIYQACPGIVFQEQPIFNDNNLQNAVYSIYSNPAKGSVSINNQGVFTYTPLNSNCGIDSFRYQVCNAVTGCCDHATVTLNLGDHVAPVLQNVPADVTINCGETVPAAPVVFGVDACPGIYVTFNEVNNQVNAGSCQQYTIVRTWTATDLCGNVGTSKQTITVKDSDSPEIFRVYTLANGKRLLAGVTSNGQTSWKHIKFPISFAETPIVFSQIITNASPEPVITRLRNIDQEGFELKIQEEEIADGIHGAERVAWMAMEPGNLTDASNLQAGLLTNVTQTLKLLSYAKAFTASPVIVASTQTNAEADPMQIRFSNSTSTSTQLKLEEEQSKDVEVVHANETVGYIAAKAGNIVDEVGDYVGKAGTVILDNNWKTIQFDRKYMKPAVLFGGQPTGDDPATIRVRNVTSNSFEAKIQEWQYSNGIMPARTVNYFVIEGSVPAYVENPCAEIYTPIIPGINLFSTDNCDTQVAMDISESSTLSPAGMIYTKVWISTDDCGNASTLIRNDTCRVAAVRLRAILAGSMLGSNANTNLMRDNLRTKGFVPLYNPYMLETEGQYALPSAHTINPSMLQVTGDNAIVDWILVEIRDSLDSREVIKSVPCLLQRDGDIITETGSDIIPFLTIPEGKYYVYIKHRNHVGMISKTPVYLCTYNVPMVDFSIYGTHIFNAENAGQKTNGKYYNWAGDLNNDNMVIYQGPINDVFTLFSEVMIAPDNGESLANFIVTGYKDTDINMDGNSIYQGPGNDRSMLLLHTILSHPANNHLLANFIAGISLP